MRRRLELSRRPSKKLNSNKKLKTITCSKLRPKLDKRKKLRKNRKLIRHRNKRLINLKRKRPQLQSKLSRRLRSKLPPRRSKRWKSNSKRK